MVFPVIDCWEIKFRPRAKKAFKKLPPDVQKRLYVFLKERVARNSEPKQLAEKLTGEFSSYWRFRVGDYRVIVEFHDEIMLVHIISVGHRKHVYKKAV